MGNALARHASSGEPQPPSAQETALRQALEEVRLLAAQSRLLALNAAFESAGAGRDEDAAREIDVLAVQSSLLALNAVFESADAGREAGLAAEMGGLGGEAGRAAAEAERIVAAVDTLLQQIQAASSPSRPL